MKTNNILYFGLQIGMISSFAVMLLHGLFFSGHVMILTLFSIVFYIFVLWFINRIINKYQDVKLNRYIEAIYFFFNVFFIFFSLVVFFASEGRNSSGGIEDGIKLMSISALTSSLISCIWWFVVRYKPFHGRIGKS